MIQNGKRFWSRAIEGYDSVETIQLEMDWIAKGSSHAAVKVKAMSENDSNPTSTYVMLSEGAPGKFSLIFGDSSVSGDLNLRSHDGGGKEQQSTIDYKVKFNYESTVVPDQGILATWSTPN